jgi:hypothetical protein
MTTDLDHQLRLKICTTEDPHICYCDIRNVPQKIVYMEKIALEQLIEQSNQSRATSLNLNGQGIFDLPDSIANCRELIYLYLEDNQLTNIPDSICQLTELNYLNLGGNNIQSLQNNITHLSKLNGLCLSGNPIKDFAILQELPKLQYVRFGDGYLHRKYWSNFDEWYPQYLLDQQEEKLRIIRIKSEQDYSSEC